MAEVGGEIIGPGGCGVGGWMCFFFFLGGVICGSFVGLICFEVCSKRSRGTVAATSKSNNEKHDAQ